jgi:hypothetical protein
MWQSQSAASARGQPFFACEMLRYHASCGRCHRAAPAAPLRCDALSTALLHHYFYKCRVLAAQKKWRERTQRRRKRLARTATSIRVVGGVRRARRPGCATSTPSAVAAHAISAAARRRSVGSDGGPHLWNDRVADGDDDIYGRERRIPSLPKQAPDHCVRTPSPRRAPVCACLPPLRRLRRHDGVGTATSSRATRDRSSLGRPSDTPAPL